MSKALLAWVEQALSLLPAEAPLVLGFSGGLDSSVLCEALLKLGVGDRTRLVHVDHGLQEESHRWAEHCRRAARERGVAFRCVAVDVPKKGNREALAREARRRALLECLPEGGALLLAHHADDQSETLLLRLMRGAGVHGLAGMPVIRHWRGHPVLRPLLTVSRQELEHQARAWGLSWVEDPSNRELSMDRNFLRHQVLPLLGERWPQASARLRAATEGLEEAAVLLDERAAEDFLQCAGEVRSLALAPFRRLSPARQRNLLHWWLRRQNMRAPGRRLIARLGPDLLEAARDRQPRLVWREGVLARHAGRLYLLGPRALRTEGDECLWSPDEEAAVPFSAGWLGGQSHIGEENYCLWLPPEPHRFRVTTVRGGERLLLNGVRRRLPELWREAGVPPWRRGQLPLFHVDGELVAAAGAGVADPWRPASAAAARRVCWWPDNN